MSATDRDHWNARYADGGPAPAGSVEPPLHFAQAVDLLPTRGPAIDVACGRGRGSVWLARRGLDVLGIDVSSVAITQARELAAAEGVDCRFENLDLDDGMPDGPPVALIVCHMFRDSRLDESMINRLAPGGVLAIAALSQVGAGPGRFRCKQGDLVGAFAALEILHEREQNGVAVLIGRAAGP